MGGAHRGCVSVGVRARVAAGRVEVWVVMVDCLLELAGVGSAAFVQAFYEGASGFAQVQIGACNALLGDGGSVVGGENLRTCRLQNVFDGVFEQVAIMEFLVPLSAYA